MCVQATLAIRRLTSPVSAGARTLPPPGLVLLSAVGGFLLLVIATTEWTHLNDEHAYWLAGSRLWDGVSLYDPAAAPNTPYAYWYPPISFNFGYVYHKHRGYRHRHWR